MGDDADDKNVEIWKVKKLIKSLEAARGYALTTTTSIIPLLFPLHFYEVPPPLYISEGWPILMTSFVEL